MARCQDGLLVFEVLLLPEFLPMPLPFASRLEGVCQGACAVTLGSGEPLSPG